MASASRARPQLFSLFLSLSLSFSSVNSSFGQRHTGRSQCYTLLCDPRALCFSKERPYRRNWTKREGARERGIRIRGEGNGEVCARERDRGREREQAQE